MLKVRGLGRIKLITCLSSEKFKKLGGGGGFCFCKFLLFFYKKYIFIYFKIKLKLIKNNFY